MSSAEALSSAEGSGRITIVVELPATPEANWVLDAGQHRYGLRVCNDVTCVTAISWRRLDGTPGGTEQPS